MLQTLSQATHWLAVNADSIARGLLVLCAVFASVHLLTMMATRWGDNMTTVKSLIFSVTVHLTIFLLAYSIAAPTILNARSEQVREEPVPIREITFEGEQDTPVEKAGNTPVWEKPPEAEQMELARLERVPLELQPLETPEKRPEPATPPEVELPRLPQLPDYPVATPRPENRGETGPIVESVPLMKIDEPTTEARPEVAIPSPAASRSPVIREPSQTDAPVQRAPVRGSIDRIDPHLDVSPRLASIDAPADPRSLLKQRPAEESIRRRTGPVPSKLTVDDVGEGAEQPSPGSPAAGTSPQFTRLQARTPLARDDGGVERFRAIERAQAPRPDPAAGLAVRKSTPIDLPRAGARPNVSRPNFDASPDSRKVNLPPTYRWRERTRRKQIALERGGTEESERAIEASLAWLASRQTAEGYWDADAHGSGRVRVDEQGVNRRYAGKHADTGITGLAVLAFLAAGYTHEEGRYADNVERALLWLIRQQRADGYLGGKAVHYARHYCHAMATYAMAEAYGMQSDPTTDTRLRDPIRRAVDYILDTQNPEDGGWRYVKGQRSDMSMFGWQLMALKSAEIAGIEVPDEARQKMIQFLKDRSLGQNDGLAGYRLDEPPSPSMTAEALFSKQMLGLRRRHPSSREAVGYLLQNLPRRSQWNLYYWYYGNLAMIQYGGKAWEQWNEAVRDVIVAEQETTGPNAGSWDPKPPWGPYGGRVYCTAMAALCLEVYARFLPLYQAGE